MTDFVKYKALLYAYPNSESAEMLGYAEDSDGVWFIKEWQFNSANRLNSNFWISHHSGNKQDMLSIYNTIAATKGQWCLTRGGRI